MEPETLRALTAAFANIAANMSETEMARLIQSGALNQLIEAVVSDAMLDRALLPVRQRLRLNTERAFKYATADLPKGGRVDGQIAVAFDHLNPRVIDAVRALEGPVMDSLKGDARDMVRAFVENGLRDGRPPRDVARSIRAAVGLGESQAVQILNFRDALEGKNGRSIRDYKLRNKTVDRLLAKGPLTPEQVERWTAVYRKARIAQNAKVVAKTATFSAYKTGQSLSWADAKESGVIPPGFKVARRWVHLDGQKEPRPEHERMNGETVDADQPYSNGDTVAGESDPWGCHCLDRFVVVRA